MPPKKPKNPEISSPTSVHTGPVDFLSQGTKVILKELTVLVHKPPKTKKAWELAVREIIDRHKLPELPKLYEKFSFRNPEGEKENIIQFLERVWYDPWIKKGVLTRAAFRDLDKRGEMAYRNWMRDNDVPDHLVLLTKTSIVDRKLSDPQIIREAIRITRAYQTRVYG